MYDYKTSYKIFEYKNDDQKLSDYFRYNQHIDEYLEDNENSKWEFNLF